MKNFLDYLVENCGVHMHEEEPMKLATKHKTALTKAGHKVLSHEVYDTGFHRILALHKDGSYHYHEINKPDDLRSEAGKKSMRVNRKVLSPAEIAHVKKAYKGAK